MVDLPFLKGKKIYIFYFLCVFIVFVTLIVIFFMRDSIKIPKIQMNLDVPEFFNNSDNKTNSMTKENKKMYCYNFPEDEECKKDLNEYNKNIIDGSEFSPPVDGQGNINSMAMFSHNKCDPKCCPSEYTCGSGCICLTDQQKCWLNRHGTPKI